MSRGSRLGLPRRDHPEDERVQVGERRLEARIRLRRPRRVDRAARERLVAGAVEAVDRLDRRREVAGEHRLGEDRERQLGHLGLRVDRAPVLPPLEQASDLPREDVAEAADVPVGERPLEQHPPRPPGGPVVSGERVAYAARLLEPLDQRPDADLVERELEDRNRELGVVHPDPLAARDGEREERPLRPGERHELAQS